MASKAFIIICVVELGKLYVLPELGRYFVRSNDGAEGTGRLTVGVSLYER
jgi:hypothetical protein